MKKQAVSLVLIVGSIAIITGCNSTTELSGDIIGVSNLYSSTGVQIPNSSGITVSIEGSNLSTTTDSSGQWEISGLTTGSYNIDVSKAGYGTEKVIDFQFAGGGQANVGNYSLTQLPTFYVTGLSDSISAGNIYFSGTFSGVYPVGRKDAFTFFGTSASVSPSPNNYLIWVDGVGPSGDSIFSGSIDTTYLSEKGFNSGETVYMVAYAVNPSPVSYTDPVTGRQVFSGIDSTPSNVVSFKMP